jgi:hypothetical protein
VSNNPVQDALEKLRRARKARADYDRKVKDGAAMFERNVNYLADLVNDQLPMKSRDECVLMTDEEYKNYCEGHFNLQLSVMALMAQDWCRKQDAKEEADDWKDFGPTNLEF